MAHHETIYVVARFWSKVDVGTERACWPWRAGLNMHGYGNFWIEGRTETAHVFAFQLAGGVVPDGMQVLHSCDNRDCCNPRHLRVGTLQDNKNDEVGRDRHVYGERHHSAKLTEDDIRAIRALYASGLTYGAIGQRYGVTGENVGQIIRRRSWRHVI